MTLDERFIALNSLNSYFVDKDTGLPLANGKLYFYRDSSRSEAKTVYQLSGSPGSYSYTALPNPITLNSVGTAQNAGGDNVVIYAFPYEGSPTDATTGDLDLYYIVCQNSSGVEQWTRQAIPNLTTQNDPLRDTYSSNNELSNPQYTEYFLESESSTQFSVTSASLKEFPIAPDWTLVVSGTGTVDISRTAVAGNTNLSTNPAYYLNVITSSNITVCRLRQRFYQNSGLWASTASDTSYIASHILAKSDSGGSPAIEMYYAESSGLVNDITLLSASLTNSFDSYFQSVTIGNSGNSESGDDAYIDIYVSISPQTNVSFTSVQVVPTPSQVQANLIPYDRRSAKRELAYMGDYYIPTLIEQQTRNLLTAWDFKLNPAQFGETQTVDQNSATGKASYIWDQTICGRTTADIDVARNSLTKGMQFTSTATATTTDSFYLMQYLDGRDAQRLINNKLSLNLTAHKTAAGAAVTARVYLFGAPSTSSFPDVSSGTNDSIINVTSGGIASLTSTASADDWFEIGRSNLNAPEVTINEIADASNLSGTNVDYAFNGWELTDDGTTDQITDFDKFACVVTFTYVDDETVVTVDAINLVPGDVAYRPLPQTFNEVLKDCERYYERSYEPGTDTGTATQDNQFTSLQVSWVPSSTYRIWQTPVLLPFKTTKRTSTTDIELYDPDAGTADTVRLTVYNNTAVQNGTSSFSTNYTQQDSGTDRAFFRVIANNFYSNGTNNVGFAGFARFHYVVDARIGIN